MSRPKSTEMPRGMRRLVIRGETWGWRFGSVVPIFAPDGRRFRVDLRDLSGLDWNDIERGTHKRWFSVEPSQVVDYIDRTLLGYDDARGFPAGVLPRGWQQTLRDGWKGIQGPRGMWQWKPAPWIIDIRSPEDVRHQARMYNLLDMSVQEWAAIKAAAIDASGSSVREEMRRADERHGNRRGAADGFMDWDGPGLPVPTDLQILAYLDRVISGMPEKNRSAA